MPLPFLVWGAVAAAGAVGVGKAVKAKSDFDEAERTNRRAKRIARDAKRRAESARDDCGREIANLGNAKVHVLNSSIKRFIAAFEKLKNIEFTSSAGLHEINLDSMNNKRLGELRELGSVAGSLLSGAGSGAVTGAITAFGAYGLAGTLGTASTGTAIASLSGAAASNATLAFLGGGSLAAGGLGVAGGMAVLGGLVAGPALAVMGCCMGAKASAALDDAESNLDNARSFESEMDTIVSLSNGIRDRAWQLRDLLEQLNRRFEPQVASLETLVLSKGTNFKRYSDSEQQVVGNTMGLAGAIKDLLDTPLLTKDGKLTPESARICDKTRARLTSGQ